MTLKSFDHPHIVKSYEVICVGSLWGLVMEYISGRDLREYTLEQGRLSETEALGYIDQIAQALDFVHQKKFFHRDVKPHNIMLRQQQQQEAVLIDFGIAKEYTEQQTNYLSNSLGTELYKPIEQYEQSGRFGPYTDIYALAVTLYHLISGDAPGSGSPLYTSKARKDAQDKGWGASIDEHLWGELTKVGISDRTLQAIQAGMQIEPSQRPQSMTEFRQLLGLVKTEIIISNSDFLDDANYCYKEGKRLQVSRDYKAAICKFDRAIKLNSQDADTYYERGYSKSQLGDYRGAIVDFTAAIELTPLNADYYYNRGFDKSFRLKYYLGTITAHTTEIELNPRKATSNWHPMTIYDIEREEKRRSEIYRYSTAIELNPCANNYYWRGSAKSDLEDYEGAIADYTIAIELDPDAITYCVRGSAKSTLGDYAGAIADYTTAIELDPHASTYRVRGSTKFESEDYAGAIADYTTAIELDPYANTYYTRGSAKSKLRDYAGAIADYTTAIDLDPHANTYYIRGSAKSKLEDYAGAIVDYTTAIELNPQNAYYYYDRGLAKFKLEDYAGAIVDYTTAIELNPQNAYYYYDRGLAKSNLEDYQGAVVDFTAAIELNPNAEFYCYRGREKSNLGDNKGAVTDYIKAYEIRDKVCTLLSFSEFVSLESYEGHVLTAVFLDHKTVIASGRDINVVRKWKAGFRLHDPNVCVTSVDAHLSLSAVFSKDRNLLATGEYDNQIKLWDVNENKLLAVLQGLDGLPSCLAFAPNSKKLASGSMDNSVTLWNLETGKTSSKAYHADNVKSIIFSPDGNIIASGSEDCTIKLWKIVDLWGIDAMENILTLSDHNDAVMSLAFSSDGLYLASGSADGAIKLWEVKTGQLLLTLENNGIVKALAFQPSTNVLASGGFDKEIRLWDLRSRTLLHTLTGHQGWIYSLEFSPDGQVLASSSEDETIKLWGNSNMSDLWNNDDNLAF